MDIEKGEIIVLSKNISHAEIGKELHIPRTTISAFFNDLKDGTHPTIFPTPVDQEKPLPLSINGSFGQR